MRRIVIERLSLPPNGELNIHQALIDLSWNEQGFRLITTNFDNRFVEAGVDKNLVDAAPKLPVPKPHTWSSLVHLHGHIVPNEDGSNLVLTAADFGRAYLTERWAARFVTELFREFTVVFVGYSVGDPVMSYMVDALAAERAKGRGSRRPTHSPTRTVPMLASRRRVMVGARRTSSRSFMTDGTITVFSRRH